MRRLAGAMTVLLLAAASPVPAMAQEARAVAAADAGAAILAQAKDSLGRGDFAQAIELLNKAAATGPLAIKREALELVGVAREKAGQLAQAKGAYETYLKNFPSGPDAGRVRQRLQGVIAANEDQAMRQFNLNKQSHSTVASAPAVASGKRDLPKPETPQGWRWAVTGTAGQFYYRDDSFTDAGLRGTLGDHSVYQDEIVSSADVSARGDDGRHQITARFSGYEANNLGGTGPLGNTIVSAAYVDMRDRLTGLSARIGRQTQYGSGIFGRFDGALLAYDIGKAYTLQAVAGSPVYYGVETPFADNRYFYGGSVTARTPDKAWSATAYALQQNVGSIVDRRAIGADLRYTHDAFQANGTLDYDIYYTELNDAYAAYTWQVNPLFSVYGSIDYRRVPFLLTSDALMGQSATSLSSLIDIFGITETEALAVDRTATAATLSGGWAYQVSDRWQISSDFSIAHYSGTPASGGVSAIPSPGMEYYLSAQLEGTGILAPDDSVGLGLRFLKDSDYMTYIADADWRYPVTDKLRLDPRLRLAYRVGGGDRQYYVMPSLGLDYRIARHWLFESQAAARWEDDRKNGKSSKSLELMLSAGYRYEF